MSLLRLEAHGSLDLAVHDEHESGADCAESVGSCALEESVRALFFQNLVEAINSALVEPFGLGLLRLHL